LEGLAYWQTLAKLRHEAHPAARKGKLKDIKEFLVAFAVISARNQKRANELAKYKERCTDYLTKHPMELISGF
jgi:hypothetical protein